jgi:hypothetical protein
MDNENKSTEINKNSILKEITRHLGFLNAKKLKRGGFSIALTAIFIAIVVLLNVVVNTLLARFDIRLDLTENRIFSIEQDTANFLRNLDDTINFYFASEEAVFTGLDRGEGYYAQVVEIARRFTESNRNFAISFIDRAANPRFSADYGGNLSDDSIIIESERTGRHRIINSNHYINVRYFLEGQQLLRAEAEFWAQWGAPIELDIRSGAEYAFLSAVMFVSDLSPVRIAFTEGFGEGIITTSEIPLNAPMMALLAENAYLIETIDMFNGNPIDPDIDYLVIFTPTFDYTREAISALNNWLDNRGEYGKTLLYFPTPADLRDTKNLDMFLADWGIAVMPGFTSQEDSSFTFAPISPESPPAGLVQIVTHGGIFSEGVTRQIVGEHIRPLVQLFERTPSFTTSVFIRSHPGTVYIPYEVTNPNLTTEELIELISEPQVFDMAIMSTMRRLDNNEEYMSHVLVFGTPHFFTLQYLAPESNGNMHLLLNIFNVLTEREEAPLIMPKSFAMTSFEITKAQADAISRTFMFIIPAVIIVAGLVVFFRRRYK